MSFWINIYICVCISSHVHNANDLRNTANWIVTNKNIGELQVKRHLNPIDCTEYSRFFEHCLRTCEKGRRSCWIFFAINRITVSLNLHFAFVYNIYMYVCVWILENLQWMFKCSVGCVQIKISLYYIVPYSLLQKILDDVWWRVMTCDDVRWCVMMSDDVRWWVMMSDDHVWWSLH